MMFWEDQCKYQVGDEEVDDLGCVVVDEVDGVEVYQVFWCYYLCEYQIEVDVDVGVVGLGGDIGVEGKEGQY